MSRGKRSIVTAVAGMALLAGASEASAAKLSIKVNDDHVNWSERATIKGKLKADAGVAAGGHEVRLFATTYPSKKAKVVETTTTSKTGAYAFKRLRIPANSKYRVAVSDDTASARSKRITVYAYPVFRLTGKTKPGVTHPTMRINYSPQLRVPTAKAVFYFRKTTSSTFVREDVAKAKQVRPGEQIAKGKINLPSGEYRFQVTACLQLPDSQFGLFDPRDKGDCPRKIKARGRQAAAFSSLSASPFIP